MFRIVTDTSANLPTDYLLSEQITIIPYTFQSGKGEQSCMDLATFDAKDFYTQMRSGVKVTTSQIPPQRYLDVLTPMLEAGEDVLFVSMSSGISGSYASGQIAARQLREEFPDRKLLLVDTYSASLGEGLLVMRAVNCRREGMCIDETYKTLLKKHGITEVYMEYAALPYGHAKRFEQLSEECGAKAILNTTLDDAIRKQRIVKSDEEVKRICDAQAITDATFEHILPYIKEGVTEREIALEIEFFMRKEGADGNAFNPIVVTGANGSQCHGIPGNTQIKKGDLITMDTGAMLAGYHSDMTRTVALGHVTEEMRRVYDTVLRAQLAGIAASHAGASGKSVDGAARDIITEAGYGPYFGHSYGHSLGLEIHEAPNCTPRNENPIPAGAVCSAEPGIYIPGKFGVRIEDVVIVEENGCKDITKSPKELIIL